MIEHLNDFRLELFYQPLRTARGKEIVGLEALIRGVCHDGRIIGAASVLQSISDAGASDELDWWVLSRVCEDAVRWTVRISVNILPGQFKHPGFAYRFLRHVRRSGLPLERLEVEIVESAFISDFETAALNLTTLRDAGVTIALDDFGTGYSSLSYLLKLPVDKIKIDHSIIENVDRVKCAAILQAIIALARSIGLKVTAEGVETAQQESFLTSAGCHYLQGFRIGRPMPAHVIDLVLSGKLALAV